MTYTTSKHLTASSRLLNGDKELTNDTIFDGKVSCSQHVKGYRYSIDAILAAHFHAPSWGEKILDIGAGCGIISLIMMYRWKERIDQIQSLEIQPALKDLANSNYSRNGFSDKCKCQLGDVRNILGTFKAESFTYVICNPPYYTMRSGRQSIDGEAKRARHQIDVGIDDFTGAAASVVQNRGTVVFIYPAESVIELTTSLQKNRLIVKNIQLVYSYPSSGDARMVIIRSVKNGGPGVKIAEPFYIYSEKNGMYSDEMQKLYDPNSFLS